jgi:hypothetical protein
VELGRIPFCLYVGVVGHRILDDPDAVAGSVRSVLEHLTDSIRERSAGHVRIRVVSSLAEGADRLVVHEALAHEGASLEVILPVPRVDYVRDFSTVESRDEFMDLLSRASHVLELPSSGDRELAYEEAGRAVLNRADVLLAIWDGEETERRAGTAPAVDRARQTGTPLYWINPKHGARWVQEPGSGLPWVESNQLDLFNREPLAPESFDRSVGEQVRRLEGMLPSRDAPAARRLLEWHIPYLVRADRLAARCRRRHARVGDAVFLLAALALVTVAVQILFWPELPRLAWIEVTFLVLLLGLLTMARIRRLHERWLSYRVLAERIRSSLFVACFGGDPRREAALEVIYGAGPEERWLKRAFEQIWAERPSSADVTWEPDTARRFVREGWLRDQLEYFDETGSRHRDRLRWLQLASTALFGLTLIAAVVHALGLGHSETGGSAGGKIATLATIVLPALGVALGGIRAQRDYLRNTLRFTAMARHLRAAEERLARTSDLPGIRDVVTELDGILMEENRDWFVAMRFHEIELPG